MDKLQSGINSRRKAEKTPQSAAFGIVDEVHFVHAGCGVDALSGKVELNVTRQPSPRYHAAQRCG
ncbi:hypothetical protein FHD46_11720 [Escherichia coli]|nr:hypothetical protein [Escherichia coli]MIA80681.1 hypothetical protein [Escherichia coli]